MVDRPAHRRVPLQPRVPRDRRDRGRRIRASSSARSSRRTPRSASCAPAPTSSRWTALDPLFYIAGAREYRALGPKVADAYSVGKALRALGRQGLAADETAARRRASSNRTARGSRGGRRHRAARFMTEAEIYGADVPPLHESAEDVRATFDAGDVTLVAEAAGAIVGTVRGETLAERSVMARRLGVDAEWRGRGIARALMSRWKRPTPMRRAWRSSPAASRPRRWRSTIPSATSTSAPRRSHPESTFSTWRSGAPDLIGGSEVHDIGQLWPARRRRPRTYTRSITARFASTIGIAGTAECSSAGLTSRTRHSGPANAARISASLTRLGPNSPGTRSEKHSIA